jgi:hypothetical protein
MANIIVLDDCIEALTKVWFEKYRGNPTWSSHYRGPSLNTGISHICETLVQNHDSGCNGSAWVRTDTFDQAFSYHAQFDVSCGHTDVVEYRDLQPYGYSEYLANVIFRVEGGDAKARFSGHLYSAYQVISTGMCLYDWTSGSTLLNEMGHTVSLIDSHIYRMTVHTKMRGFNDPDEIVIQLGFENTKIAILDQPILCCPMVACPDEIQRSPIAPKLEKGK